MRRFGARLVACGLAGWMMTAGAADATPVDITGTPQADTFTSFGTPGAPGVHGLELRGGNNAGNGTWELGLGAQTSVSGSFDQGQLAFGNPTPGVFNFEYNYGNGTSDFRIWAVGDSRPVAAQVSYDGLSTGNAVQIYAKRQAEITITEFDGMPYAMTIGDVGSGSSVAAIFADAGFLDGFNLQGTLSILGGNNSAKEILIKAGDVQPVPLPAALPLFLTGLAGLGVLARRRKAA